MMLLQKCIGFLWWLAEFVHQEPLKRLGMLSAGTTLQTG